MKFTVKVLLLIFAVVGLAGCAGTQRLRQCEGPWTPVNSPVEAADET